MGQPELKDMRGNSPELGFYKFVGTDANNILVFKDKSDGFWKARHYIRGEPIHMKLSQVVFGEYLKRSDEEIKTSIKDYKQRIVHLIQDIKVKKGLEQLSKTQAEQSS